MFLGEGPEGGEREKWAEFKLLYSDMYKFVNVVRTNNNNYANNLD